MSSEHLAKFRIDQIILLFLSGIVVCIGITLAVLLGQAILLGIIMGTSFFIYTLKRLDHAVCLLIFLSPFTFIIKGVFPSLLADIWQDVYVLVLLFSWLLQIYIRKLSLPRDRGLSFLIVMYVFWGLIEILNSQSFLLGIAGFRYVYAFVPLYFIATSTIQGEKTIRLYIGAIVLSAIIVSFFSIEEYLSVFMNRASLMSSFFPQITIDSAIRSNLQRATTAISNPNELGDFIVMSMLLMYGYFYYRAGNNIARPLLIISIIMVMLIVLLFTISRTAIMSFAIAFTLINLFQRRGRELGIILVIIFVIVSVLPFSLYEAFKPVMTGEDLYFTSTLSMVRHDYLDQFLTHPLMGTGFSIHATTAEKLGIIDLGSVNLGGADIHFVKPFLQFGIPGGIMFFLILYRFFMNAFWAYKKRVMYSAEGQTLPLTLMVVFFAFAIQSLHHSLFEYLTMAGSYYVLGAVATASMRISVLDLRRALSFQCGLHRAST